MSTVTDKSGNPPVESTASPSGHPQIETAADGHNKIRETPYDRSGSNPSDDATPQVMKDKNPGEFSHITNHGQAFYNNIKGLIFGMPSIKVELNLEAERDKLDLNKISKELEAEEELKRKQLEAEEEIKRKRADERREANKRLCAQGIAGLVLVPDHNMPPASPGAGMSPEEPIEIS